MNLKYTLVAVLVFAIILCGVFLRPSNDAERRVAITRVVDYDFKMYEKWLLDYFLKAGLIDRFVDVFGGESKSATENTKIYAERLRLNPLDGCPRDFKSAYRAHVAALAAGDPERTTRTWDKVISVAYKYGVDVGRKWIY